MFDRSLCLVALALALPGAPALGQVPHTFSVGAPAKASEVNENFDFLWSRVKAGRVHVHRSGLECANGAEPEGSPYCALDSTGGAYDPAAPYTVVTTAAVPDGQYLVLGKITFRNGSDPRNAWYVVECILRDNVYGGSLDDAAFSGTVYAGSSGLPQGATVSTSTNMHVPLVMFAAHSISTGSGGTVTLSCRVQGQDRLWNGDGTFSAPTPIHDVRINGAKISAVAVGQNVLQPNP